MYTIEEIYVIFRKVQGRYFSRPFRIPKNIANHIEKLPEVQRKNIEHLTNRFITRWNNIDPEKYFESGFELLKDKFTYVKFLHPKIILHYIEQDKNSKRFTLNIKKEIVNSIKFVNGWMKDKNVRKDLSLLSQYCMMTDDNMKAPIKHYLLGKVNKYFIVWLLYEKRLFVTVDDDGFLPYIEENYRTYVEEIKGMLDFLKDVENTLERKRV